MKVLFGASGHAKVILDILNKNGESVEYILDDNPRYSSLLGVKVKVFQDQNLEGNERIIVSIGQNEIRKAVVERLKVDFFSAIHQTAILDPTVCIKGGAVVMAGAIINSSTSVGQHCIINTAASIDHDCELEDFVHVSPNATLCGGISVGEGTHIGAGATVIPNLKIGKWATVGAGSVVIRDVPDYAKVVGNPARIIELSDGK